MKDHVSDFIEAMRAAGAAPANASEILPTDKKIRYRLDDDKPGKKTGECVLAIEDDFAYGGFINYREGQWHSWHSKGNGEIKTDEEKAAFKKKLEEKKKAQDEEDHHRQIEAAAKCKAIWDASPIAGNDHPYLARKLVKAHGCRVHKDNLLVPMYRDNRFLAYQKIKLDGEKKFPFGISTKGAYGALTTRDENKDRILICEGYATGASLREATGYTVIIAFNKGNLLPVALTMRAKYPKSQIIICEDNDQWTFIHKKKPKNFSRDDYRGDAPEWKEWREKGWLINEGHHYATQAAGHIKGFTSSPPIPEDDPDKRTDFNDLHAMKGLEVVKARIDEVPVPNVPIKKKAEIRQPDDWAASALIKKISRDGQQIWFEENSFNYSLIVRNHPRLQGVFAWDEFHLCPMMIQVPPWPKWWNKEAQFKICEVEDPDIRECDYFIQNLGFKLRGSEAKTRGAIEDAALENPIHPLRDYFDELVWDQKPRLDDWLVNYCFCTKDDPDIVRAFGRTWMIAAVKRIYEPGCKFDHMLILEGAQGARKTTALETLATFGDPGSERKAFQNTFRIAHCDDPDELLKLTGALIVEIQEMAGFTRRDDEAIKAFITTTEDTFRAPYARKTKKWPRQFVLAGTYNPKEGIFRDPTGLRRFWVVTVAHKIDIDALRRDRSQLWAEAVHRYKAGESIELSRYLYEKAEVSANKRRLKEDMTQDVLEAMKGRDGFETREVLKELGIPVRASSSGESRAIANILRVEGFKRVQEGRKWLWYQPDETDPKPVKEEEIQIDDQVEEIPF